MGKVTIDGFEMTFWNEYMTLEKDGERYATFPDLIMTLDAKTARPGRHGRPGKRAAARRHRGAESQTAAQQHDEQQIADAACRGYH